MDGVSKILSYDVDVNIAKITMILNFCNRNQGLCDRHSKQKCSAICLNQNTTMKALRSKVTHKQIPTTCTQHRKATLLNKKNHCYKTNPHEDAAVP